MSPAGSFLTPIHGVCVLMRMLPAPIPQNIFSTLLKPVLFSLIIVLLGAGFVVAAEIDDSSLFIEAFSAYQKKDYLLSIEKIGTINQLFPDTPLRDAALLLLARSALKSGDNELAAKTISQFKSEFPASPLLVSTEEELQRLGTRWQKGERPPPAIPLRTAARKVRNEQMALERSIAERIGQERLLAEKAEQGRITLEKTGAERHLASEKALQESVRASISIPGDGQTVAAGQRGELPFEVVNLGTSAENFVLEASAPPEYESMLKTAGQSDEKRSRVTIGPEVPFRGSILFRMPPDKIDGHKASISLRAVSEKYQNVVTREAQIITAAPLIRVVAKPEKQRLAPGEQTRYHVTVLNVGTLPARGLDVRVFLPAQIEFLGRDGSYLRETTGGIIFRVDTLNTGKLIEFAMDVKVREDCLVGQELRSKVEVVHNQLQIRENFTSAVAVVQAE
jgi:Domain of unknown function DUF11/Outer membrane lipoprotein